MVHIPCEEELWEQFLDEFRAFWRVPSKQQAGCVMDSYRIWQSAFRALHNEPMPNRTIH